MALKVYMIEYTILSICISLSFLYQLKYLDIIYLYTESILIISLTINCLWSSKLTGLNKKPITLSWEGGNYSLVEISGLDIGWGQVMIETSCLDLRNVSIPSSLESVMLHYMRYFKWHHHHSSSPLTS